MIVNIKMNEKELNDIYKFHSSLTKKFGNELNISNVYVSKADLKKLERSLKQKIKEEQPHLSGRQFESVFGISALNMIPNDGLMNALKEGYVAILLID